MGRGKKVLLKLNYSHLAELFSRSEGTVKYWVSLGLLDPTSLEDILEKKNSPWLLDRRRNAPQTCSRLVADALRTLPHADRVG